MTVAIKMNQKSNQSIGGAKNDARAVSAAATTTTTAAAPPTRHRHHYRHRSDTSAELFEDADTYFLLPTPVAAVAAAARAAAAAEVAAAAAAAANNSSLSMSLTNNDSSATATATATATTAATVPIDEYDTKKLLTATDRLNKKISRTKNAISREQLQRDENVKEYLDVASKSDKQQLVRIKSLFEKKNQKSAHNIAQLQKKLESYVSKLQDIEMGGGSGGSSGGGNGFYGGGSGGSGGSGAIDGGSVMGKSMANFRPTRDVLRDVGQGLKHVGGNIRDGITGLGGSVMSKPREFAHLIKNKFGSADNINEISTWYVDATSSASTATTPTATATTAAAAAASSTSFSGTTVVAASSTTNKPKGNSSTLPPNISQQFLLRKFPSEEESDGSSMTSESVLGHKDEELSKDLDCAGMTSLSSSRYNWKSIYRELRDRKDENEKLKEELESFKNLANEVQLLSDTLQEERFRVTGLEEQINDLTELHQNEMENLKQGLIDMEEKVQYQSEERLRDILDTLDGVQTKMAKLEHLTLQQQQYVSLDGLENSNARVFVVKLINIVLTVLQVVLLLVATFAGILMPFIRTRVRFVTSFVIAFLFFIILKQWPEFSEITSHLIYHLKRRLDPSK